MILFTLGGAFILILIGVLVGKSAYMEFTLRRKEKPVIIRFFGTPLFFNITIILIILLPTIIKDIITKTCIFHLGNLYVLLIVIFLIYQSYVSSEILIFSHGIFYLGTYIKYENIKRIELVQVKNKYSIEVVGSVSLMNVNLNLESATKFYKLMVFHGVNIYT
ncbi:DUF986 family protein [Clostridium chrysemydis]|uniref:DUF986 family protein n=1 Tax=Clostridium chrysemydis TaxID=2665504 RepID=UPI00188367A6|nr:DUF986 family protein [Clostridium chrysemydis]